MTGPLEFHLELMDGSRTSFRVSDSKSVSEFLEQPKPPEFFNRTFFAFEAQHSVTVIPSGRIVSIDLVSAEPLPWIPRSGTDDGEISEISKEELEEALKPDNWKDFDRSSHREKGELFEGVVQMRLVSGTRRTFRSRTTLPPSMQQRMLLEPLLKRPVFMFPRLGGGLCFINTAAVLRLDLLPGLPEIAPGALKGSEI